MKSMIIVALALVALAVAVPVEQQAEPVPILKSNFDQTPEGGYKFEYESADGSVRQEEGRLTEVLDEENKPHNVVVVRGSYSYPKEDGTLETISYQADQDGYRAEGPSVPKAESS